jgi:hypothetical protein
VSVSVFSVCLLISVRGCTRACNDYPVNICASSQVSALMKLVRKAAASKQFQSELVDLSRNTFRSTVPGEIAS